MNKNVSLGQVQVESDHYIDSRYDSLERWNSYWYQIEAIRSANPCTLLEIGVGTGLTTWYARNRLGIAVTTCDFDPKLNPDIVADVRHLTDTISPKSYDTVVAFQVLEHLPIEDFPVALQQLSDIAKHNVVISLPHAGLEIAVTARFWRKCWKFSRKFPRKQTYRFDIEGAGQHHWEVGVKQAPLSKVRSILQARFKIDREYLVPENPYHIFWELSVI